MTSSIPLSPYNNSGSQIELGKPLELLEPTHRGLHRFVPRHPDEIEVDIGDPVYVQKEAEDLWCEGNINLYFYFIVKLMGGGDKIVGTLCAISSHFLFYCSIRAITVVHMLLSNNGGVFFFDPRPQIRLR